MSRQSEHCEGECSVQFILDKVLECLSSALLLLLWNLSTKDTLNKGHLSSKDTVCSPNHIELCTNLPLNQGQLRIRDSQLGLNGVL